VKTVGRPFGEAVVAKPHPPIYLMHKYWARKPHNVVRRYIEYYTDPGDTVLDPFMGSGVTVVEAAGIGRKAIGNDLNPIAALITEMTLMRVDERELSRVFRHVEVVVGEKINSYYGAVCSRCHRIGTINRVVWKRQGFGPEKMFLLSLHCDFCGSPEERKPTDDDLDRYAKIETQAVPCFYPADIPLHASAKRSVSYVHELFTKRSLITLSLLLDAINGLPEKTTRDLLRFCFCSNLAQVAKLNSIDMRKGREWSSRGWVINNYWVPKGFLETNVWSGFRTRFSKLFSLAILCGPGEGKRNHLE